MSEDCIDSEIYFKLQVAYKEKTKQIKAVTFFKGNNLLFINPGHPLKTTLTFDMKYFYATRSVNKKTNICVGSCIKEI